MIEVGGRNSETLAQAIGRTIKEESRKRGITTTELARRVGISQAQISRLENGRQGFRSGTLQRIAEALGESIQVVFETGPEKKSPPAQKQKENRHE